MKCLDIFAGIGGFHLGLEQAGHTVIGAIENDKYKLAVYTRRFPDTKIWHDVNKVKTEELPDADIYAAGCPCPAFSTAGIGRGFTDPRGKVFFEVFRLAQERRPRYILIENVKGLLSNNAGNDFARILAKMDEIGYDAEWQVLDTKYFLPQTRERVFLVGHARDRPFRQIFPLGETSGKPIGTQRKAPKKEKRVHTPLCGTLDKNYQKGGSTRTMIVTPKLNALLPNSFGRKIYDTKFDRRGVYDGKHVRRLTPIECARIQGFPDNWCDNLSESRQYACYGDAVSVPVVKYIAENLHDAGSLDTNLLEMFD